ncbi:MAG: TetR/AcrR family transcriptional regulator [Actinomycetia bacterium]|nr:TetR/AcrR family transcriptional regulator [Actinomycetes bacterium]
MDHNRKGVTAMTQLGPTEPTTKLGRKRDPGRDRVILDATLDVLAESGYDGMTIDMVAARAKAGKATLYRRWSSKGELVIDAVASMKPPADLDALPDTGSLRGDLIASLKAPSAEVAERKLNVMAGIVSLLNTDPSLADATHRALVEPEAAVNRILIQRAIDRGEVSPDCDVENLSIVVPAMAAYRTLLQRRPIDRDFLVSIIDGVVVPTATGATPPGLMDTCPRTSP